MKSLIRRGQKTKHTLFDCSQKWHFIDET